MGFLDSATERMIVRAEQIGAEKMLEALGAMILQDSREIVVPAQRLDGQDLLTKWHDAMGHPRELRLD